MAAYYDKDRKYWSVQFRYTDWTGIRKKKHKRGFKLKREAEEWERQFLLQNAGNPEMTFGSLVDGNCNIKLSMFSVRTNLCYMIYPDFDRIAADLKLMPSTAFS